MPGKFSKRLNYARRGAVRRTREDFYRVPPKLRLLLVYFAFKAGEYGHPRALAGLSLFVGLYLMAHLPVAYLMIITLIFYGSVWAFEKRDIRIVLRIGFGLALAILLSSIYLMPAVLESGLVTEPCSSLFKYHRSYVTLVPGADAFGKNIDRSFVFMVLTLVVASIVLRVDTKSVILRAAASGKAGMIDRNTKKSKNGKSLRSRQEAPISGLTGQGREDI